MSQRSYTNDRYRKDAKIGSTRKSASKAKPIRKQGSVESATPAGKPKKTKDPNKDFAGLPTSPEIKKWRRVWWALLLGGLALISVAALVPGLRENNTVQSAVFALVLGASVTALFIDLRIIRKLQKELIAKVGKKKSSKHADKDAT
jgi:hypothetical protein